MDKSTMYFLPWVLIVIMMILEINLYDGIYVSGLACVAYTFFTLYKSFEGKDK